MSIWTAIGSLAGAGVNWINQRRAEKRQDRSLQRLVADAKAAGISPLAALGSSAAGQYGAPVGSTGSGSHIADAIGAMVPKRTQQLQNEQLQKQNDLIDAQIRALDAETVAVARSRSIIPSQATINATHAAQKNGDNVAVPGMGTLPVDPVEPAPELPTRFQAVTPGGNRISVPGESFSPDELVTAWIVEKLADDVARRRTIDENLRAGRKPILRQPDLRDDAKARRTRRPAPPRGYKPLNW